MDSRMVPAYDVESDVCAPLLRQNSGACNGEGEGLGPLQVGGPLSTHMGAHTGPTLHRRLTFLDGISVVVGVIIGSGIFASPGVVLSDTGSVGLAIVAWCGAGLIAMLSSLIYAELGAAIPSAGGDAEYLRLAFGNAASFAFTWSMFFVLKTGGLAIVAITFARYFASALFHMDVTSPTLDSDPRVKGLAVACIIALTVVNCLGVHIGSLLQNVFAVFKAVLVLVIVAAALSFLLRDTSVVRENLDQPFKGTTLIGLGPGMVAALWAFDGWCDIVFLSEELKNPARDVPRCAVTSILIVCFIYVIINVTYLCVLPTAAVKLTEVVAIDVVSVGLGNWAGTLTALLVAASVLGSCNGSILCGGRYLYSAARSGQTPKFLAALNPSSGAPYAALIAQGAWCCVVLLMPSSNLVSLIEYFGIASWLFYGSTAAAHIKIRWDHPNLHRPFNVQIYPLAPITVVLVSLYLMWSSLVTSPIPACLSLGFVALSYPTYYIFCRQPELKFDSTGIPISLH